MFLSHIAFHLKDNYLLCNLIPLWVCCIVQDTSCLVWNWKRNLSNCIGKSIVIYVFCPLVCCYNISYMVITLLVNFNSAGKELGNWINHFVAFISQPIDVLGYLVIVPSCQWYTPTDVMFHWPWHCPNWSLLCSWLGTFPGVHRSWVSINKRVLTSCFESINSIGYHIFC